MNDPDSEAFAALKEHRADDAAAGMRLDQWLAAQAGPELSRSRVQALIRDGKVTLNGATALEPKRRLAAGDRKVLEAYTRTAVTATAGFTHIFTEELSGKLFATGGQSRYEDDEFGRRDFTTIGLAGTLTYDSRDNPADAASGVFLEATVTPFYEFQYGNPAVRAVGEARAYHGFGADDRFVLAGRAKLGMLAGPSVAELPPDMLFFAGGGGSVRGYAYRNIGVVTPAGNVIGGRSLAEASLEARMRVTDSIGLVAFADAGYVGADTVPGFSEDVRVGVGAGLRYLTGLGPLRLDVAVPLDRRSGDPSVAVYVGIGQSF